MSTAGFHLALPRDAAKQLFGCKTDEALREFVETYVRCDSHRSDGLVLETGSVWQDIHRLFSDGTLNPAAGEFPLNHCILGGRQLHQGEQFVVALVRPDMTAHVAEAIEQLDREKLHQRYLGVNAAAPDSTVATEDFIETWQALVHIGRFFAAAAQQRHAVVFAAPLSDDH